MILAALPKEIERRVCPARPRQLPERDTPIQLAQVLAGEVIGEVGGREFELGALLAHADGSFARGHAIGRGTGVGLGE